MTYYAGVGLLVSSIDALDAQWHFDRYFTFVRSRRMKLISSESLVLAKVAPSHAFATSITPTFDPDSTFKPVTKRQ